MSISLEDLNLVAYQATVEFCRALDGWLHIFLHVSVKKKIKGEFDDRSNRKSPGKTYSSNV